MLPVYGLLTLNPIAAKVVHQCARQPMDRVVVSHAERAALALDAAKHDPAISVLQTREDVTRHRGEDVGAQLQEIHAELCAGLALRIAACAHHHVVCQDRILLSAAPPEAINALGDFVARDLRCFSDFIEWFASDVTVTVYRELDGRIARMLPQTSPEVCARRDRAARPRALTARR